MFLFLSPGSLRGLSTDRRETLRHDRKVGALYKLSPKILGALTIKLYPLKNFGRFSTTSEFDREYLRNGAR